MNVYQSLGILKSGNTDENDFTYTEISVKILSMCLVVLNSYDVSEMWSWNTRGENPREKIKTKKIFSTKR